MTGTCEGIAGRRVLDPPTLLQQESAEPPVLALIVLDVVKRPFGLGGVLGHHVDVHERAAPEEAEASGAAEDAAHDVLRGLLQPVADGVLELLVPDHETGSYHEKKTKI